VDLQIGLIAEGLKALELVTVSAEVILGHEEKLVTALVEWLCRHQANRVFNVAGDCVGALLPKGISVLL
jgi:hypothetical protein